VIGNLSIEKNQKYLNKVWDATNKKVLSREMEATAMLMLSQRLAHSKEFIAYIREKKENHLI